MKIKNEWQRLIARPPLNCAIPIHGYFAGRSLDYEAPRLIPFGQSAFYGSQLLVLIDAIRYCVIGRIKHEWHPLDHPAQHGNVPTDDSYSVFDFIFSQDKLRGTL